MKPLLISLFLLILSPQQNNETYVYLCMGKSSECYHKKETCRGLKNCSKDIIKVTIEEAKAKYHRRPCGYCYKTR